MISSGKKAYYLHLARCLTWKEVISEWVTGGKVLRPALIYLMNTFLIPISFSPLAINLVLNQKKIQHRKEKYHQYRAKDEAIKTKK